MLNTARRCWRQRYALTKILRMRRATGDALRFGDTSVTPAQSVLEEFLMAQLTHGLVTEECVLRTVLFLKGSNFAVSGRNSVLL